MRFRSIVSSAFGDRKRRLITTVINLKTESRKFGYRSARHEMDENFLSPLPLPLPPSLSLSLALSLSLSLSLSLFLSSFLGTG